MHILLSIFLPKDGNIINQSSITAISNMAASMNMDMKSASRSITAVGVNLFKGGGIMGLTADIHHHHHHTGGGATVQYLTHGL
jgi:hypothetical protein